MSSPPATAPDPADHGGDGDVPPFGLPVLAEVPELAHLLSLAVDAERLTARLVEAIILAEDAGLAPATTGVGLDQWLATVARSTGSDRRMLLTAARVCRRLPSLRAAFAAGTLSWSQVRAVALRVERSPIHLDDRIDAELARAIDTATDLAARPDPDALVSVIGWALAVADTTDPEPPTSPARDALVLQPRLDGSGGRGWFDLGPVGFAAVDAATDPGPPDVPSARDRFGDVPDPAAQRRTRQAVSQARAARLVDLCLSGGAAGCGDGCTCATCTATAEGRRRAPTLLLRAELDAILGDGRDGAQLLTTLAGGRMHADSATARHLVDRCGADLRLVLLDDGKVVGIGTEHRQPPGERAQGTRRLARHPDRRRHPDLDPPSHRPVHDHDPRHLATTPASERTRGEDGPARRPTRRTTR